MPELEPEPQPKPKPEAEVDGNTGHSKERNEAASGSSETTASAGKKRSADLAGHSSGESAAKRALKAKSSPDAGDVHLDYNEDNVDSQPQKGPVAPPQLPGRRIISYDD